MSSPSPDKDNDNDNKKKSQTVMGGISRLDEIWRQHLDQYRKVDDLEKRVDEHAKRLRRRVVNLLETQPTHRLSHLRLFVSHEERSVASDAVVSIHNDASGTTGVSQKWTLTVEGKLLIGHLDHASAEAFDQALRDKFQESHGVSATHSSLALATSQNVSQTCPTEEEEPVKAAIFTHFFDKMVVQFQSLFQPEEATVSEEVSEGLVTPAKPAAPAASTNNKKKSRSAAKRQKTATQQQQQQEADDVEPSNLTYSDPTE
ncbi:expressed unknown protein (Partial), partial [Seminavis robusta]|eukprot:Sro1788_g297560.1 n/a (258) ;mRNA; r:2-775